MGLFPAPQPDDCIRQLEMVVCDLRRAKPRITRIPTNEHEYNFLGIRVIRGCPFTAPQRTQASKATLTVLRWLFKISDPLRENKNLERGQVAQLVEQRTENPRVGGSTPSLATNRIK